MNQAIDIAYWLGVATWFGGVLFVAAAAPIIFRVVRDHDPTLPMVLSVNLEGQHAGLLSGDIVQTLLSLLRRVWAGCAVVVGVAIVLQWTVPEVRPPHQVMLLRICLWAAATVMLAYDAAFVGTRARQWRAEYVAKADEPDVANAALEQFDRYHRESIMVLAFTLFALLGLVFFGASSVTVDLTTIGK